MNDPIRPRQVWRWHLRRRAWQLVGYYPHTFVHCHDGDWLVVSVNTGGANFLRLRSLEQLAELGKAAA